MTGASRVHAPRARDGRPRALPVDLSATASPDYLGRAVAALAADPHVLSRSSGELARDYGFTDVDGSRPEPFRIPGT